MINKAYTALTDIKTYLSEGHPFAEYNCAIVGELTENGTHCGLFEPLAFLNLLYDKFTLATAYKMYGSAILEHLNTLELSTEQREYLHRSLVHLIHEFTEAKQANKGLGMRSREVAMESEPKRDDTVPHPSGQQRLDLGARYTFEGRQRPLKHYKPTKGLDAYMETPLNLGIFWMMTEEEQWKSVFDPLVFFKVLYRHFEIVCDNSSRPLALRTLLLGLGLDDNQGYLFLHYLLKLLMERQKGTKEKKEAERLQICVEVFDREYQKLRERRRQENRPLIPEQIKEGNNEKSSNNTHEGKETKVQSRFSLSPRNGAKTDLVRLLNAIYHLKLIHTKDGMLPTKDEFMRSFGQFLGTDLEGYSVILSRAVNSTGMEANMKVFKELSGFMEELLDKALEDPKR